MYQYRIRRSGDERLELRVGWIWRVFFLGCCGFLAWTAFHGGGVYPLPAVIGLICLVAGLYNEYWAFDRTAGEVISLIGLFPIMRRRVYELDSLDSVRVRMARPIGGEQPQDRADRYAQPAVPRAMQRRLVRLSLRLRHDDGATQSINLQTESQSRYRHLITIGQAISEFCRVPLETSDG